MEYQGDLYGKIGNKYPKLKMTTEDVDSLEKENLMLKEEMGKAASKLYKWAQSNDDYIAAAHFKSLSNSEHRQP